MGSVWLDLMMSRVFSISFYKRTRRRDSLLQYSKRKTDVGFCLAVRDITNTNNDEPINSKTSFYGCELLWLFPSGERMRLQTDQLTQKEGLGTRFIGVRYPTQEVSKHSNWKMNAWEKTKRDLFPLREESTNILQMCARDKAWGTNRKRDHIRGITRLWWGWSTKTGWVASTTAAQTQMSGEGKAKIRRNPLSFCALVSLSTLSCSTKAEGSAQAPRIRERASDSYTHVGLPRSLRL